MNERLKAMGIISREKTEDWIIYFRGFIQCTYLFPLSSILD
jgi:hypothetical protein